MMFPVLLIGGIVLSLVLWGVKVTAGGVVVAVAVMYLVGLVVS